MIPIILEETIIDASEETAFYAYLLRRIPTQGRTVYWQAIESKSGITVKMERSKTRKRAIEMIRRWVNFRRIQRGFRELLP